MPTTFATEVAKLTGQRRVFMRFAASANPGVLWIGAADRRYGKTPDPKGDVPVSGTVETMGTGTTFLVNPFYHFETPTIRTVLADDDREWARLAGNRGAGITTRWVEYYLRHETPAGEIVDELVNRGQIIRPTYTNGKMSLDVRLSPGKFFGKKVPRRTVDQKDWPFALPDNYGKVVNMIVGQARNYVAAPSGVTIPTPSGVIVPEMFLAQDPGLIWQDDFESYTGPDFAQSNLALTNLTPNYWVEQCYPGSAKAGIGYNGSRGIQGYCWSTEFWKMVGEQGREGAAGYKYYTQINKDTPNDGLYNYLFEVRSSFRVGTQWLATVYRSGDTLEVFFNGPGGPQGWGQIAPGTAYVNTDPDGFGGWTSDACKDIFYTPGWYDVQYRWRCSSLSAAGVFNPDGIFEVMVNGRVILSLTGANFTHALAGTIQPTAVTRAAPYLSSAAGDVVGYWNYLMISPVGDAGGTNGDGTQSVIDQFWIRNTMDWRTDLSTATPATRCGSAGVGSSGQGGGAVRCLLVDTGDRADGCTADMAQVNGLTAVYVAPVTPAAPTGLAGVVQAGGFGSTYPGGQYYRVTAIKNGVESARSNTVGPFVLSGSNRRVALSWDLHPDADYIRVYGSQQSNEFGQLHRYRYSSPYPGLVSDLPGTATSLVDDYASITSQAQLNPDPRWDTIFRAQYYYYVAAKVRTSAGLCETPMAGPIMVQRTAPSTSFFVDVAWNAYSPPVSGQILEGYVLRRQSQGYSWDINWTGEWVLGPSTLTYRDDVTEKIPITLPGKPVQSVKYLVCGHTPKAVPQVYVLKPRSSDTATAEGNMAASVPPDYAASTGPVTLTEPQQILQVEGVDYTRETVEVNGRRYHLLTFTTPQRGDNCQEYEVTANVDGVETNADGTGELIEDASDGFLWVLLNIIFNTYDSSIPAEGGVTNPNVPSGGKYFTDVPYAPGLIDTPSFATVKATLRNWLAPSGYLISKVLDTQMFAEEMLAEIVQNFGFDLYWSGGQWHLGVLRPTAIVPSGLPLLDAEDTIFKDTLTWWFDEERFANVLPYKLGPIANGYLYTGEVSDAASIAIFDRRVAEELLFNWTRDKATGLHVAERMLAQVSFPALRGAFRLGAKGLLYPPSTAFRLTHPYGPGPSGFAEHVCRVTRSNPNFDDLKHSLEWTSIDTLVRGG